MAILLGCDSVSLEFPTKHIFDSVTLGVGAGHNWWCVVFPPLCTAAASDVPTVALDAGLTDQEVALITEADEGYVLKFRSLELLQALKKVLFGE